VTAATARGELPCRDTDPIPRTPPDEERGADMSGGGDRVTSVDAPAAATAFTIEFGDDDSGDGNKAKKTPRRFGGLREGIGSFAPRRSNGTGGKSSPTVVDRENNNVKGKAMAKESPKAMKKVEVVAERRKIAPAASCGDDESDTGTYTIDDDTCAVDEHRQRIAATVAASADGGEARGSQERIRQWAAAASSTSPATPELGHRGGGGDGGESSASPTDGHRSRRRLPSLPASPARTSPAMGAPETEAILLDTVSTISAMEARLSTSKKVVSARLSAKEEKKLAWERRKNYQPTLTTRQQPLAVPSGRLQALPKTTTGAIYVDSDSALTATDSEAEPPRLVGSGASSSLSSRPNRAFALRQKLNAQQSAMTRSDGGRSSLRATSASSSSGHSSARRGSAAINSRRSDGGGRSTSSLSSREVEFQAWKRRKNYDPRRSARSGGTAANMSTSLTTASPRTAKTRPTPPTPVQRAMARVSSGSSRNRAAAGVAALSEEESSGVAAMNRRSASFHYPDGLSRVNRNVYTSEDDGDEEGADEEEEEDMPRFASLQQQDYLWQRQEPRSIHEVSDDEFILAIGNGGAHGGSHSGNLLLKPTTRPSSGQTKPSSRGVGVGSGSQSRMEALDNLVISTVFSLSAKLCRSSSVLVRGAQCRLQDATAEEEERRAIMDTMVRVEQIDHISKSHRYNAGSFLQLYVLEDTDPPPSPSKRTSRELAGTLRNLKKVEQALQILEECNRFDEGEEDDDEDTFREANEEEEASDEEEEDEEDTTVNRRR